MKVQLSVDSEECDPYPLPDFERVAKVLEEEFETLWGADILKPDIVEISVSFVTEDEMRELNNSSRGDDSPTDVLSFPMWEDDGEFEPPESDICPVVLLGDIVISPKQVAENAEENKLGFLDEFYLVFAHSVLHLFAWDHDTEEKQAAMWERQESIKNKFLMGVSS